MRQLVIGLIAEGTTDIRFLKTVIFKSIQELSWQCDNQIEILDIREVSADGNSFSEKMLAASKCALQKYGVSVLCIHADSDARSVKDVIENKFAPFFEVLEGVPEDEYCKYIIPTIPIQMIESWMLADKDLFKQLINAIGTRNVDLGIEKDPEAYSDPKCTIENAIRIAMSGKSKRKRDQISISDLYEFLGNRLELDKLRTIHSFVNFESNIVKVFKAMGLMR